MVIHIMFKEMMVMIMIEFIYSKIKITIGDPDQNLVKKRTVTFTILALAKVSLNKDGNTS